MKCPNCGKNNFFELDAESIQDTGQCKGFGGCKYSNSVKFVQGYWKGKEEGECKCQPVRINDKLLMIAISGDCDQHKYLLDHMEKQIGEEYPLDFSQE